MRTGVGECCYKATVQTLAGHWQGGSAHIGGVVFPTDEALLDRSLLVGNITSVVNTEQVGNPDP